MTAATKNFGSGLSLSLSESQTRFAVTSDNVRELSTSLNFNNNKIQQKKSAAKPKKQYSSITPAVQVA